MEPGRLEILHEHYRDSCTVMQAQRSARDRYFYMVIGVVSLAWFDVVAPKDFSAIAGELLKSKMQLAVAPDLAYLRSVLWFLLLGLTVRYFQTSLSVERSYDYVHELEEVLAEKVHTKFGREGTAYLSKYPLFLKWAHSLYVFVAPAILLAVVAKWTAAQTLVWNPALWPGLLWFDWMVSTAIVVSVSLYWAFRVTGRPESPPNDAQGRKSRHSRSA